ncbi:MAG: phosphoribosylformylglycinamidine synthase [Spirochaetes bacterium]|nr:phosphoribosylformylglycinamidine synthase [Spirochaetota bacterium]
MRIEVFNREEYRDGRVNRLIDSFRSHEGINIDDIKIIDVYNLNDIPFLNRDALGEIFSDRVVQRIFTDRFYSLEGSFEWDILIETAYKPGVTDPVAITVKEAVESFFRGKIPSNASVKSAVQYLFKISELTSGNVSGTGGTFPQGVNSKRKSIVKKLLYALYNPLIEEAVVIESSMVRHPGRERFKELLSGGKKRTPSVKYEPSAERFDIAGMDRNMLVKISKERLLALSFDEMKAIQNYFVSKKTVKRRMGKGIGTLITDVELEMIAQTWSEHCKHKIFNATIRYNDGKNTEIIKSLFKTYIARTTEETARQFLKSVFHDNSGVIQFDEDTLLCFKVETHNSPSALDPYGGAITGIVGVNRDIMGTGKGARPIFNTDVLCFGYPETPPDKVPEGLMPPRKVMEGVHKGIVDGGNQSGIPVAGGAFLFDESFSGKPLVFCGTGGILPAKIGGEDAWIKHIDPGDLAVMAGGRIGKDGIHGATFSSLALDEASPSSAVQIGDPITQKKMLDFLLEARDSGLYKGITDNGAGGLSSSLGEMAELSGGVEIYLDKCPLKYKGLKPWEILVSESQERMSLSVDPARIEEFLELASKRDVEASVIGRFTDSGFVTVYYGNKIVADISLEFLHKGLPELILTANRKPAEKGNGNLETAAEKRILQNDQAVRELKEALLLLLSDPNVASKENLVRQYDHEVQGLSVVKPFVGAGEDAPSDGAVLKPKYNSNRGITVTHGICPRISDIDSYSMAMCAVDEAVRAHVALGGDPGQMSALDNFCWPDPVLADTNPDGDYKLAQLVRACMGLKDACVAYGLPLISGKDSMKNDTIVKNKKLSVRPTLLVSLMGIIPDIRKAVTTDFKAGGDVLFILGSTNGEMGGTLYDYLTGDTGTNAPAVDTQISCKLYQAVYKAVNLELVSSCHDLSDGGFGVALAESALGGRLGAEVALDRIPGKGTGTMDDYRVLFCESPSRFLVSVKKDKKETFKKLFTGLPCAEIGMVTENGEITVRRGKKNVLSLSVADIERAWKNVL